MAEVALLLLRWSHWEPQLCAHLLGNLVYLTLAGKVLLSRDKDWASLKCGFGVWGLGMQSLPIVVPKTAFRLKCQIGIQLKSKDFLWSWE